MFPLGNELSVIFLPVMAPDLQTFLHLLHHRQEASLFLNTTIIACLYWVPFLTLSRLSSYLLLRGICVSHCNSINNLCSSVNSHCPLWDATEWNLNLVFRHLTMSMYYLSRHIYNRWIRDGEEQSGATECTWDMVTCTCNRKGGQA